MNIDERQSGVCQIVILNLIYLLYSMFRSWNQGLGKIFKIISRKVLSI